MKKTFWYLPSLASRVRKRQSEVGERWQRHWQQRWAGTTHSSGPTRHNIETLEHLLYGDGDEAHIEERI